MRGRRRETAAARELAEQLVCALCGEPAALALLLGPDDDDAPLLVGGFCSSCWVNRPQEEAA